MYTHRASNRYIASVEFRISLMNENLKKNYLMKYDRITDKSGQKRKRKNLRKHKKKPTKKPQKTQKVQIVTRYSLL